MATATSPAPEERSSKRPKPEQVGGSASQPPPDEGGPPGSYNGRGPPPPVYHYPPASAGPPPMPPGGYMAAPPYGGQYGGHHWGGGPSGGHGYPSSRPPPPPHGPERGGWGGGYRNPPPPSRNGKEDEPPEDKYGGGDKYGKSAAPSGPPYGSGGGWGHHSPQSWQQPYGGYGGPPPPPPPPPPMPPHPSAMYNQPTYGGKSPPRVRGDLYGRPSPQQVRPEMDISYLSTNGGMARPMMDDDGANSSMAGSDKDKGRGSYKCGRCGVPKKGHVCPYQPKIKRRPDQPPPETRHAAVQVEMDEFMTLRRLNIRIQGFPESYATEPYMMAEELVGGEPRHVTNDSVHPPPPPMNGSVTAIPFESKADESMEEARPESLVVAAAEADVPPRPEVMDPPGGDGSRPSSGTATPTVMVKDTGVGDGPVDVGMEEAVSETVIR